MCFRFRDLSPRRLLSAAVRPRFGFKARSGFRETDRWERQPGAWRDDRSGGDPVGGRERKRKNEKGNSVSASADSLSSGAMARRAGRCWPSGSRRRHFAVSSHEHAATSPKRILLLRLERVGDLVMVLDAIAMARRLRPQARDRSRRRKLECRARSSDSYRSIPSKTLDVPWMAREGAA